MQLDSRGLEITTASADAVRHLDAAVADYLDYGQTASAEVKAALDADPDCALAQCYRGYLLMMLENRAVLPKVQQALDALAGMADDLTPRERLHAEALQAWVKGDLMNACLAWEAILNDWPRDVMALKLHHTMAFYTGRAHVLRSVVSGVLGEWDDTIPNYANVQGMYAYALEECGDYAEAERWGREATDRNPGDLWAIHSVAHVLEMQGRASEGAKWLDQPPERWANKNFFKAHVWWHGALFHFAQENFDEVFRIFDEVLTTVNSDKYVDVSNQAALLKRLEIAGLDVGDRWDALAEHSQTRIHDHILPFRDAHFCLALAADGRVDMARKQIDSLFVFAREGDGWTAETTKSILIPLCEAIIAYESRRIRQGLRPDLADPQRAVADRRQPCPARSLRPDPHRLPRCAASGSAWRAPCCRSAWRSFPARGATGRSSRKSSTISAKPTARPTRACACRPPPT
ncbi:MAG: tetratricopeptide repeat protein [Rhodobiaceae bacterium]|nr:tetratricopeptide repeat protein [Rhodobiaceae bacterium]